MYQDGEIRVKSATYLLPNNAKRLKYSSSSAVIGTLSGNKEFRKRVTEIVEKRTVVRDRVRSHDRRFDKVRP